MSAPFKPFTFLQWEILEPCGSGLHGQCYRARHKHTGDPFAIKMMHLEDTAFAGRVRNALSTAKATYRIRSSNVVTVHDLGCEDDGRVWIVMEWLEGRSIADMLARQRGRLSVLLALHVAIETAWGVDAAHEQGIIHRDIKPDNVWMTPAGQIKVLDFSLAKVIPEGIATTVQLGAVTGAGTIAYLAPEGLRPGAEVDPRVDIYALGIMLWQSIAGRHPFQDVLRNPAELMRRQLHVDPEPLSKVASLPGYVDEFMARAVAKDPDKRFSTIAEMARAMMTLRDRLHADVEHGALTLAVPPGEPPVPRDDPGTRRDYRAARMTPDHQEPPPETARRIVLSGNAATAAASGSAGTDGAGRLARAQPLANRRQTARTERLPTSQPQGPTTAGTTLTMGNTGAQPVTTPSATSGPQPARETAPAIERGPQPRHARGPAALIAVVLAAASIASIAAWWHRRSASPPSVAIAAAPLASSVAQQPTGSMVPEPPTPLLLAVEQPPSPGSAEPEPPGSALANEPAATTSAKALPRRPGYKLPPVPPPLPAPPPPPPPKQPGHGPIFPVQN